MTPGQPASLRAMLRVRRLGLELRTRGLRGMQE